MPVELAIQPSSLFSFLAVLARVSGIFAFANIPGFRQGPGSAKVVFSLLFTLALMPVWPALPNSSPSLGVIVGWLAAEALFGLSVGLLLTIVIEAFLLMAQVISLQSGLSYASAVDPTSLADSGAIALTANLTAGLLLFATGLHRQIILALARSLEVLPPGTFILRDSMAKEVVQFSGTIFSTGLRLALPIMAFLFMLDIALSLLGRINPGVQLFTLSFPVKILVALLILTQLLPLFPDAFERLGSQCMEHVYSLLPAAF